MTKVKICGISQIDHALAAAEAGADFIGMVFASSKRQISPQTAQQIVLVLEELKPRPLVVGVFVNTDARQVNRLAATCRLDWVQLSGDETWEYCKPIEKPIIKTIHVANSSEIESIMTEMSNGSRILKHRSFTYLLDTRSKDIYGGTGQTFDWELASQVSRKYPVILAGGLSSENVEQSIKTAKPWGVDVSSGVETNGIKDISKIETFISVVRRTDEEIEHTA